MKNRTLLFVMDEATPDADIRRVLETAAPQNARIVCLLLAVTPTYPLNAFGALPYGGMERPGDWLQQLSDEQERIRERADALEALLQRESVSGDVQPVQTVPGDVAEIVARRALVSDLAYIASNMRDTNPDLFRAATHGILFQSPIALTVNGAPLAQPERVFVAWNTEVPAARAIHYALPLLKAAKDVHIGSFDARAQEADDGEDPGADLAKWLSHHGCAVTVNQYSSGGADIGTAIQQRAAELGADLVVMGAYGRSRLREFVFGGTTRSMLEQTGTPVLLAH